MEQTKASKPAAERNRFLVKVYRHSTYPGNMAFLSWCGGPVARLKRL